MRNPVGALVAALLLAASVEAMAQQRPPDLKTIPDSINFIWKDIEHDFIALAEAMPEEKWNFKPTQGEFSGVRTFGEQVKHVACGNEGWAKQIAGEKPPQRCDIGGPNPAKTKSEVVAYLRDSFVMMDKAIAAIQRREPVAAELWTVLGAEPTVGLDRRGVARLRPLWPVGGVPSHEWHRATCQPVNANGSLTIRRFIATGVGMW